jgi:hypothetical protein
MADTLTITPTAIPHGARRRVPASTRMLHEWATLTHGNDQIFYELKLGPTVQHVIGKLDDPKLVNMLRVTNWYADATIVTPDEILIVEAAVAPNPGKISQLEHYRDLVLETPLLKDYPNRSIAMVLLFGFGDSAIVPRAQLRGIRVEIYTPSWLHEYLITRNFHKRYFALG